MTRQALVATVLAGCLGTLGCAMNNPETPQQLDRPYFRCRVEPALIRSCAFYACHGAAERPLRVYGPNRLRLDVPEARRAQRLTDAEHDANYRAALRFAEPVAGHDEPLLVEKPLDESLGGAFHRGAEDYGGDDVFADPDDPGLAALRGWVSGAREEPSCVP